MEIANPNPNEHKEDANSNSNAAAPPLLPPSTTHETVEEFRWNLKRLIREGFPEGIGLHILEDLYPYWLGNSITPAQIDSRFSDWNSIFKNTPILKQTFTLFKKDQLDYVKVRRGPDSPQELALVLRIVNYSNMMRWLQSQAQENISTDVLPVPRSPDSTARNSPNPNHTEILPGTSRLAILEAPRSQSGSESPSSSIPNSISTDTNSFYQGSNQCQAQHEKFSTIAGSKGEHSVSAETGQLATSPLQPVRTNGSSIQEPPAITSQHSDSGFVPELIQANESSRTFEGEDSQHSESEEGQPITFAAENVKPEAANVDLGNYLVGEQKLPCMPQGKILVPLVERVKIEEVPHDEDESFKDPNSPNNDGEGVQIVDLTNSDGDEIGEIKTQNDTRSCNEAELARIIRLARRLETCERLAPTESIPGSKSSPPNDGEIPGPSSRSCTQKRAHRKGSGSSSPTSSAPTTKRLKQSDQDEGSQQHIVKRESSSYSPAYEEFVGHVAVIMSGLLEAPLRDPLLSKAILQNVMSVSSDWMAFPIQNDQFQDDVPNRGFYMCEGDGKQTLTYAGLGVGWTEVKYRCTNGRSRKGLAFELPPRTLVYGEFVDQSELGKLSKTIFYVIDAAMLNGIDISCENFEKRRDLCHNFIKPLQSNSILRKVPIKLKPVVPMCKLQDLTTKLKTVIRNDHKSGYQRIVMMPEELNRENLQVQINGVIFIQCKNTHLNPEENIWSFVQSMSNRYFWQWNSELALCAENIFDEDDDELTLWNFMEQCILSGDVDPFPIPDNEENAEVQQEQVVSTV